MKLETKSLDMIILSYILFLDIQLTFNFIFILESKDTFLTNQPTRTEASKFWYCAYNHI